MRLSARIELYIFPLKVIKVEFNRNLASLSTESFGTTTDYESGLVGKNNIQVLPEPVINDQESRYRIARNTHVHTSHSDGNNSIVEIAAEAAALGLTTVGFADHWDPLGVTEGNFNSVFPEKPFHESFEVRREIIEELSKETRIFGPLTDFESIGIADGAELEFYYGREDDLKEAIEQAGFDYLYLSVHKNNQGNDYRKMQPESEKDAMQIIGSYFRDLREAYSFADEVESIKVIAHPDGIERNDALEESFEDDDLYHEVLREEYHSLVQEATENDVMSELNGRILLRKGETEWYNVLSETDIDYVAGTDSHRVGAKDKFEWVNETQARLRAIESRVPDIGREPENVLEDIDTYKAKIPNWLVENIEVDDDSFP